MSFPYKPWATTGPNALSNGFVDERQFAVRTSPMGAGGSGGAPPPLPPRRHDTYSSSAGVFSNPYGGDHMFDSPYGMPYSSMSYRGGFGGGYGFGGMGSRGGFGPEDPSSPFQTVESIVRTMSSLTMMVESTYQSMYMSFRAVLGVADNMDRLRRVVLDVFGSLTLFKTVVWFFKKILYVLGLIRNNPIREKLWEAAAAEVAGAGSQSPKRRTWPLIAFISLMLGGPYILYKLADPPADSKDFDPNQEGGVKCIALYNFDTNRKGELPFRCGELLIRHPTPMGGWVKAMNKAGQTGLVPADRLKPISNSLRPKNSVQVASAPVPVVRSVAPPAFNAAPPIFAEFPNPATSATVANSFAPPSESETTTKPNNSDDSSA